VNFNRSAIDQLCNLLRPNAVVESTTTASIAPAAIAGPTAIIQPVQATAKKRPKLSDLLKHKKLAQEDENANAAKPVIPADAKLDQSVQPQTPNSHTTIGQSQGQLEPFIPTSVALVAPDTTPDAEIPLSPSQAPQAPTAMEEPTMSSPEPMDDGSDVMRTLIGNHQKNFKPTAIVPPQQANEAMERALRGETGLTEDKSGVATKASSTAAAVVASAQSGNNPAPHHNPESLNRGIAVTRQLLGLD
jgi:hypothetical protein